MPAELVFQTILSTIAVMLTVSIIIFVIIGVGLVTTTWWGGSTSVMVRSGIWLGWFWVAVYVSVAHLFFAMQPPVAIPIFIASAVGWLLLAQHLLRARQQKVGRSKSITKEGSTKGRVARPRWHYVVWALAFALFALLSNQVLRAPIFNFDAGWYRIPFVTWAAEFPAVPGLANLNLYFGYGHVTDVISALFSYPFVDGSGYRLINTLVLVSLALDVIIRTCATTRWSDLTQSPQFLFISISFFALLIITPTSSIWISTTTVDLATAIFFLASIVYQVEAILTRSGVFLIPATTLLALATVLRPPYLVAFMILLATFVIFRFAHLTNNVHKVSLYLPVNLGVLTLFATQAARTYVTTGFPFFPFSRLNLVIPDWAVFLGNLIGARELNRMYGFAWTVSDPWKIPNITFFSILESATMEPSVQLAGGLLLVSAAILIIRSRKSRDSQYRRLAPLVAPWLGAAAILLLTAWASAQPRFFWGPLLTVGLLPVAIYLSRRTYTWRVPRKAMVDNFLVVGLLAFLFFAVFIQKGYLGSALINPVAADGLGPLSSHGASVAYGQKMRSNSGLELFVATTDGQCWQTEPPCAFSLDENLELRGETLREGFRIRQ